MFRWILPALVSGCAALVSYLPLGWAAQFVIPEEAEIAAPDLTFRGSIWNGTISGLPIFGTANIKTSLLSRRASVLSGQGRNYLSAEISSGSAQDVDLRVDFKTLPVTDGRLQNLQGELIGEMSELNIDGQGCTSANGTLRTDVLQRNGGDIKWTGPELSGPITCEDGAVIAALSGRDAQQSITADIRLNPDGVYRADISVQTRREEADVVLPLFGFTRSGRSFVLTEQGRWR